MQAALRSNGLALRRVTQSPSQASVLALGATPLSVKPRFQYVNMAHPNAPKFMDTLPGVSDLPFEWPAHSWLTGGIGNTPMVQVDKNMYAKLEGHNPGGSLKDRTLASIVTSMFKEGTIKMKGDTIVLVTSGSAGYSLINMQKALTAIEGLELNIVVVMPKAYAKKEIPAEICALDNTKVVEGSDALLADMEANKSVDYSRVVLMDGIFMDVLTETKALAAKKGWVMIDQHFDKNAMDGHKSTSEEIMLQVPGVTDVVCATGTGATAAGLMKHLPDHVLVHSRPATSGSIDGLSNVGRYDNFCDQKQLQGYDQGIFEMDDAVNSSIHLDGCDLKAGLSTGATYWLGNEILKKNKDAKVVFICADGKLERRRPTVVSPQMYDPLKKAKMQFSSARHLSNRSHRRNFGTRRSFSTTRSFSSAAEEIKEYDSIIVGGGPVGASTAWFLSENEKAGSIMCIHDPANKGAHEDWSRLARLSFDGPLDEMILSKHAVSLLDMADEVRSYQSGAPVVPIRPGMLFLASPGTNLAKACAYGEANFDDPDFIRRDPSELEALYPGNTFNLPPDTLCWSHPVGLCVSPLELAQVARGVAQSYGVEFSEGQAKIDVAPAEYGPNMLRVTVDSGEVYHTRNCYLMAGAQSKKIVADAIERDEVNEALRIPEFDDTYITAISTVRYKHRNHPANPTEGSGHVPPPITLGQLEIPELCGFQANFSVVAEEYGDVLKTRLSGAAGNETIDTVADMHKMGSEGDEEMAAIYEKFFGTLFPYLETEKALDFNRCVTYRNFDSRFSGTSLVDKVVGKEGEEPTSRLMTTVGCFGVGVKFGPALGQAAAAHTFEEDLEEGMHVFKSGAPRVVDDGEEKIERAW